MKIAIFTNNYLPNPYGVSTSIEIFRREFERLGHTVYVFAPDFPGYSDNDPRVFRYPSIDINIKFKFPLPVPFSWKIGRQLEKLDLDVIHAQHPNLLGWAARRWARKKNIPLIFTWHTLYDKYTNFAPFVPEKLAARFMINKAVKYANQADAIVIPTASISSLIRNWGVKNPSLTPIATGVIEEEFQNPDPLAVRKKFGLGDNDTVLFTISRLSEEKNIEFLFRAVNKILKNRKDIIFLVAGDGYLLPRLKEYCERENISDQVIFCGVLKRDQIKDYLAAADIFLYGSRSETQGMVVTEAMYAGLAIVAVNATGISSLVLNRANGFLVKEDEDEFSSSALKLIEDKALRKKFGAASAQIARSQFTSRVTAGKLLDVYNDAIDKRKAK